MADVKAIAEELVNLTVKEVNELVNVLKVTRKSLNMFGSIINNVKDVMMS